MKKYLFLVFIGNCSFSFSQIIPNSGFENWITNTETPHNYLVPTNWITMDMVDNFSNPAYTGSSVIRTAQSHTGAYAVLMQRGTGGGDTVSGSLFSCNSIANFIAGGGHFGFPFTTRPATFTGWYKFTNVGDLVGLQFTLTKWNTFTNKRDTLAKNSFFGLSNVASYTQLSIPLTYSLNVFPDSASIIVAMGSMGGGTMHAGTQFFLDDLAASGSVPFGIEQYGQDESISLYPNPSAGILNIELKTKEEAAEVNIMNYIGEEVFRTSNLVPRTSQIDISSLPEGIYFVKIKTTEGIVTKKIVVQR